MKTKLNISTVVLALFGFIAAQNAAAQAPNPVKAEAKTAEPKFVYYRGKFTKFHPGKREEATNVIYRKFWTVEQAVGRKPIPFEFVTGEWDHMVFFRLHGGLAEMELNKAVMQANWNRQLEKQEGGPEKAKALHEYHDSLVMKSGGGLFKVPADVVDFADDYFNLDGKESYHSVSFIKFKSGKKDQATEFALKNFLPVSRSIVSSVIPMISVAGGWDHIVFKKMPNGIADPRSNSISKAWSEEFAKQQGGKEKAEEAMKFWNNSLLQEKVTEIAKSYLEKIMPSHNYPDVFVIFRKHGGKTGAELKAEGKCNTSYSQLLLRCKRFTRYQE